MKSRDDFTLVFRVSVLLAFDPVLLTYPSTLTMMLFEMDAEMFFYNTVIMFVLIGSCLLLIKTSPIIVDKIGLDIEIEFEVGVFEKFNSSSILNIGIILMSLFFMIDSLVYLLKELGEWFVKTNYFMEKKVFSDHFITVSVKLVIAFILLMFRQKVSSLLTKV